MKLSVSIAAFLVVLVVWNGGSASLAGDGHNLSAVNGSVRAESGTTYDTLSTVNGDVRMERGATADNAKTVNGEVRLESEARVGSASTVNGTLEVAEGGSIVRDASTVNGGIRLARSVHVGGDVTTVSGEIELNGADVGGRLTTNNGNIDLTDGAKVRGGIHVKKSNDWGWSWSKQDPVKVHVCGTCAVDGELRFDRPVELRVDDGARIGKVIGDSVTRR
jgi:DUF4097 and DUF4098 domain-containing protein YvlB